MTAGSTTYNPKKIYIKIDGERLAQITELTADKVEDTHKIDEDLDGTATVLINNSKLWTITGQIQQNSPDIATLTLLDANHTIFEAYYEDYSKTLSSTTAVIRKAPSTQKTSAGDTTPTSEFVIEMGNTKVQTK